MCLCICGYVCLCMKEGKFHLATTKLKPQQSKLPTLIIEVSEQHELQNMFKCSLIISNSHSNLSQPYKFYLNCCLIESFRTHCKNR